MEWVLSIRSPIITPLFQYITWLGYSDFLFLFIPFCYWFCDRKIYSALPQFVFISALLNSFAKSLFKDPRPDGSLNIDPWLNTFDPSFGFPSGHAHLAVVIWGFIFLKSNNIFIKAVAMFLLVSVSFSRIYLGVHDIGDVIGGMILGIISLLFIELLLKNKLFLLNQFDSKYPGLIYLLLIIILLFIWPNDDISIVIGLGFLIIGFWLGQFIDKRSFEFNNSFNLKLKFISGIIALVGFIFLDQLIEKLFSFINAHHLIETLISSTFLGFYISFISLFILNYLKLQNRNK
jgi:glycerophosphoryl diester phosphodiesterase